MTLKLLGDDRSKINFQVLKINENIEKKKILRAKTITSDNLSVEIG